VSACLIYSARYHVDIGPHVFPTRKYALVYQRLAGDPSRNAADGLRASDHARAVPCDAIEPRAATWDELALVHTEDYLTKLRTGTLSPEDVAQLELPWSAEMVEAFRLMTGGTVQAALIACGLEGGSVTERGSPVACHIGGGLHHAFPNHGEGFCPFNDVAVAVRVLQARGLERAAVIDLDVHHGNGTAFIFNPSGRAAPPGGDMPRVFTFSMHQQHNYPMWKPRGSLDIGLPDGAHDATYLAELERALPQVMASGPQCAFYLAGADPYEDDQLGGLRVTKDGLRRRDRLVIDAVRRAGAPLVVVLAGGYARRVEDTVDIHVATIEEAFRG
jgi:acetoin utilization deacetylase AcuC-like enzyme